MISQSNMVFPAVIFTASGITSAPIDLSPSQSGANGAYSAGAIAVRGLSLTTATFGVLGSSDGGQTYFPLNISSATDPGTVATTVTVTANGLYYVDLTAITHIEFVTSGTFTGTSVAIQLTGSPNGDTGRTSSGGGGGGAVDSVFGRTGDVVAATNDYSFSQISGTANLASQVTGTLPVANGGTGANTAPSAGQIPVAASGTVYTPRTMSGDGTLSSTGVFAAAATLAKLAVANTWALLQTFTSGISIAAGQVLSWNSDTGISRTAAGNLVIGNGTQGSANGTWTADGFHATTSVNVSTSSGIGLSSNSEIGFSSTTSFAGTRDIGIDRSAAGILEVNNGTLGNSNGSLKAATLFTTATVPASATATGIAGAFIVGIDGFVYICTATNTWVRVQGLTWV